jgi:hypothetical protein
LSFLELKTAAIRFSCCNETITCSFFLPLQHE